jgi:hypothetical protein
MAPFPQIPEWVQLEHRVQEILTQQEIHGWRFDEVAAWQLTSTLREELQEAEEALRRNTLTLQEQTLLQNEITAHKDMRRVHPLLD